MMFQVIQSLTPYTSEVGDCVRLSQDILLNCGFPVVSTMSDCPTFSDAVAYEYRCHATVLPFYVINLMPYIVFGGEYTCFLQVVYLLKIHSFLRASCFCAVGPKLGVIRRRPDPEHTTFDNLCGQYLDIRSWYSTLITTKQYEYNVTTWTYADVPIIGSICFATLDIPASTTFR